MDVHNVAEKSLNTLKIVYVAQIKGLTKASDSKSEDPLATEVAVVDLDCSKEADDPLNLITEPQKKIPVVPLFQKYHS